VQAEVLCEALVTLPNLFFLLKAKYQNPLFSGTWWLRLVKSLTRHRPETATAPIWTPHTRR
jgi:hypothetical protein